MRIFQMSTLVVIASFLFWSCEETKKTAETGEAKKVDEKKIDGNALAVDVKTSSITWAAAKGVGKIPAGKHNGTFNIKEGAVYVKEGTLTGGKFMVDVNTLKVLDIPESEPGNAKLTGHLKSKDFFETEKFPTATFEIASIEAIKDSTGATHKVTGNLELKGVKKSVVFPAKISIANDKVEAEASFTINRKDWNMNYGSDESLGDKFIRNEVTIGFKLAASK